VLVMEYIEGLRRFGPSDLTQAQRREVVRRVLHGVSQMLFLKRDEVRAVRRPVRGGEGRRRRARAATGLG